MTLSSIKYLLFLAAVCTVYYRLPQKFKKAFLLAASYVFYALYSPVFAALLLASSAVTALCAVLYERRALGRSRLWIVLGAVWLFGVLFLYKYLGFFAGLLLPLLGMERQITFAAAIPVGISFYTFSAASYLFDVGRGKTPAEKSFPDLALYLAFFPTILSGPINRAEILLPQIKAPAPFSYSRLKRALLRFTLGAVKKIVIADTLAILVNAVYADVTAYSGGMLLLAALLFSLQLYFDFSGYSDMALSSALLLGFELPENFRAPFLSTSVRELWKRWHISLQKWLTDYIYYPLGGGRVPKLRKYLNILIVFAVSGLWHGANMTFIIWGLLNGVLIILGDAFSPIISRKNGPVLTALRCVFTFLLFTATFVFFRADTTADALHVFQTAASIPACGLGAMPVRDVLGLRPLTVALASAAACLFAESVREKRGTPLFTELCSTSFRFWISLALLAVFIALFGTYGDELTAKSFLYFEF